MVVRNCGEKGYLIIKVTFRLNNKGNDLLVMSTTGAEKHSGLHPTCDAHGDSGGRQDMYHFSHFSRKTETQRDKFFIHRISEKEFETIQILKLSTQHTFPFIVTSKLWKKSSIQSDLILREQCREFIFSVKTSVFIGFKDVKRVDCAALTGPTEPVKWIYNEANISPSTNNI